MSEWVGLPLVFTDDGWQDYEALIRALLGLIAPAVPENTQMVEWWDEAKSRVLIRLTLYQGFHFTLTLALADAQVDAGGLLDGLNTMLAFMDEPGRFMIDDARRVTYREMATTGVNESWEQNL